MKLIQGILLVTLFSLPLLTNEQECIKACDKFFECVKEFNPGKTATAEDKKKSDAGCMNTCKKKTKETLACYKQGKDSCQNFYVCLNKASNTK